VNVSLLGAKCQILTTSVFCPLLSGRERVCRRRTQMSADKVGVARPPAHVVRGRCRTRFQETLQRAGYCGGNNRIALDICVHLHSFAVEILTSLLYRILLALRTDGEGTRQGAWCNPLAVGENATRTRCGATPRAIDCLPPSRARLGHRNARSDGRLPVRGAARSPGGGLPRRYASRNDSGG
jgi:hypothetical protein